MSYYECMICGSHEHVLREGKVLLCSRCVEALSEALSEKLTDGGADSPAACRQSNS